MMEDCITISDDEVECVKQVINLTPIVIDLTDADDSQIHHETHEQIYEEHFPDSNTPQHNHNQSSQPKTPPRPSEKHYSNEEIPQHNNHRNSQPEASAKPPQDNHRNSQPKDSAGTPHYQYCNSQPKAPPEQSQYQYQSNQPEASAQPPQYHYPSPVDPQPNLHQNKQPEPPAKQPDEPARPLKEQQPSPVNQQPNLQQNIQPEASAKRPLTDHEIMIAKKNLANEKYKKNQFNDAIRTYREASELAKRLQDKDMSATIHFNLAMTYDRLGSYVQAADECASAVKLKDDYMKPHLKRAEIFERLHKFDEAVICWEHICELEPSNREYGMRLSRVREAAKRSRKKDPLEILELNPVSFTRDDLKKAYKKKALKHHPDRHPDVDIVTRRIQEKLFKDASEAHSYVQLRYGYR